MATTKLFHRVSGIVTDIRNNPVENLIVKIFDKDLRSEQLIGEGRTDRKGHYALQYDPTKFLKAEKKYPDLAVKVFTSDGKKTVFEPSINEVRFNAKRVESIHIQLREETARNLDEFNGYISDTAKVRGKLSVASLEENEKVQDITFLSKECDIPPVHLNYLAVAHRLSAKYKIDPAFFYGLFRKETLMKRNLADLLKIRFTIDLNTNLEPLFYEIVLLDEKVITRDIGSAVQKKTIATDIKKKLPQILSALQKHTSAAKQYNDGERKEKILNTISEFVLSDKLNQITSLYTKANGNFDKFIENLEDTKVFSSKKKEDLAKSNLILTQLVGFDDEVMAQVKTEEKIKKPEDLKKLVHLDSKAWKTKFTKAGSSFKVGGKTMDKKLADFHARALVKNLEARYPSEAYVKRLAVEKSPAEEDKKVLSFLKKHNTIDLRTTKLDLYFKEEKLSKPKDTKLKEELKKHQRLFRLTPTYKNVKNLRDRNIHSAQGIVAVGRSRFINEIAPKSGMSKKEARYTYDRAESVQTATMLIAGDLQAANGSINIPALNPDSLSANLEKVGEDFPNLKTLFQLADICECEHCRSVYSPAAYMVETLQFLDKRNIVDTTTTPYTFGQLAKDKLFERRADLGDLDLSCNNANTPVPYIDLVCEILEEQISPDLGIPFNDTITEGVITNVLFTAMQAGEFEVSDKAVIFPPDVNGDYTLRDKNLVCKVINTGANQWNIKELRQTHASAEELSAAPYYVNGEAYTELNNKQFAFALPFDLNHTEASAYYSRFGLKRSDMMRDFQINNSPAPEAIAAEKLGLTEQERVLISTPDAGNQKQYWNTTGANPLPEMRVVETMLDKTGLTYQQLVDLLELKFIRKAANPFIKHLDSSCNTAQKEIENLSVAILDRIHRFLRLWNILGWKFETLDEIIWQPNLGNKILNNSALIKTADLVTISEKTGIKIDELIGCYGDIPHELKTNETFVPLYQDVFLNKAKNGVIEEGLKPENIGGGNQLQNLKAALSLILQISEAEFDTLLTIFPETSLTWPNLSTLFAYVRFCQKKRMKIEDFISLHSLTNLQPFSDTNATKNFIDHLERSKKSPISIKDVKFMLRHEATDLDLRTIGDDKINETLLLVQSAIQDAYLNNFSAYDDSMTSEELSAAVKNNLLRLPEITEEIANDFVRMGEGNWSTPPDLAAGTFIDDHLSNFFDTTPLKTAQAAIGPNLENEKKAFIKTVLDALSQYLYEMEKESGITQILSEVFKQEEELVDTIMAMGKLGKPAPGTEMLHAILVSDSLIDLTDPELLPVINEATYPDQYNALRLLHKLLPLWASFGLNDDELPWWLTNAATFNWLQLDTIPYASGQNTILYNDWENFILLRHLAKTYSPIENPADPENPFTFQSTMELLLPGSGTSTAAWLDQLSLLTGYDRTQLEDLDAHFGWSNPDLIDYLNPLVWIQFEKGMDYLRKMNITVAQAIEFTKSQLLEADTAALRVALKSRYSEDLWLETLKEIMDTIRPQKRDALVAYLLAVNPDMTNTNHLYDYFLIDTEMEACMPSSRIVQAHGVIQLFVQRCLMGLEPETAADVQNDKGWEQWKWMRMYRVWEANRKVFLYPENWIEPELLDDKSYLFAELENELLQNELNEFTTEDAVIRYVEKLDDISFLEVMTAFYEVQTYTMHVFARTKGGDPAQYYYRRFEGERYWTPWEKVALDISSNQLLAFKRNDRLHLAWPLFSEEHNPNERSLVPGITGSEYEMDSEDTKPQKRLRIQLAISQLANGMWKPKKISQDGIATPTAYTKDETELDRSKYNLIYEPFSENIMVFHTDYDNDKEFHTTDGVFKIAGCQGYPELISTAQYPFPDFYPDIKDTWLKKQRYLEQGSDSPDNLLILNLFSFFGFAERLEKTPGLFRITHPFQLNLFDIIGYLLQLLLAAAFKKSDAISRFIKLPLGTLFPYFFEDSDHAYTIIPGLYGTKEDDRGDDILVKRTFSDIHKLLLDMFALYQKYVAKWQEDPSQDPQAFFDEFQNDPDTLSIKEELQHYKGLKIGEQYKNLYHPLICLIRRTLYNDGVEGIMKRELQLTQTSFDFNTHYVPTSLIVEPYPVEDLDFDSDGSYSAYNWELFYHTPLMIANRLRQDQKFEEAMDWYHYMFNPTGTLEGETPQKYWVTKPFFLHTAQDYMDQRIDTLLYKIADPTTAEIKELEFAINQWREKPFRPHTVARFRPVAYQKTLLLNYIKNLTEWGDYQFRIDSMESIVQATQLYVLAGKLLGEKPRIVPPIIKPPYQTYNQIENDLDAFGNALVELENLIPDLSVLPQGGAELPPPPVTLSSLYFCIPMNDKMLDYWDLIEDRLFKIRNCQNIEGVERSLALFSPPIDPGALVKAAAAGLDISSIIAGMNAPLPHYRFNVLAQKATELVQEIRSLGNSLLQALEKKDAEEMALLRNSLELKVLKQMREIKVLQIDEAIEQIEVLKKTKVVTEERNEYYSSIEKIISNEQLNLDKLAEGQDFQFASQIVQATGAILGLIPDFNIGGHGAGGSPAFHATFGGSFLAEAASAASSVLNIFSSVANYEANRASILGGYDRRWEDWKLQEVLSEKELEQIDQQIVVSEISKSRNQKDLENHDIQIENNEKTDDFMRDKYTNKDLYQWMIGEITGVYFRAYQLAFDMAKKAEKCYQHELGNTDTFIDFGYWDSMKKGLLTSDQLLYDIKRMEVSYLVKNKREYELTKHISLDMLDPLALTKLKATGSCDFEIPEALFDMDHPGHFFRRTKSVSISIPCIAGPYTSVSGKLSLITNKYRKTTSKAQGAATPLEEYQEVLGNDDRFNYNIGTIQSVATSNGQNDSGLFELNFRDERYLPFEGTGAISSWRFELPVEVRQFDYNTIRDIIIHVKYTAKEGGSTLRNLAETTLMEKMALIDQELSKTGLHKAISFRHEMPNEWHLLTTTGEVNTQLEKERLSYFVQPLNIAIEYVMFIAKVEGNPASMTIQIDDTDLVLNRNDDWQMCINQTSSISLGTTFKVNIDAVDQAKMEELMMVVKYGVV